MLTVGTDGLLGQTIFVDAAIAAGVKRILPSEFGCDLSKAGGLPVFGYKIATRKHLESKVAEGADSKFLELFLPQIMTWHTPPAFTP